MKVKAFELQSNTGLKMTLTNYGATLMRLQMPLQSELVDIVLGLPKPENYTHNDYKKYNFCLGATIGRYAGRISNKGFNLNHKFYELDHIDGITLHGGFNEGFDKKYWKVEGIDFQSYSVKFSLKSPHLSGGFPGNLKVYAVYQLFEDNLKITYSATTDLPTYINLTNHSYFTLGASSIFNNLLQINSDRVLETTNQLIPTGNFKKIINTPLDFSQLKSLDPENFTPLDTPFLVKENNILAQFINPKNGVGLIVKSNQPSVVVFTPRELPDFGLNENIKHNLFPAICFECQNYPDAPNNLNFPSALLMPEEEYINEISYQFYQDIQ